jgi:hypothetical protein
MIIKYFSIILFLTIQCSSWIQGHECSKNSTLDVKTYVIDLDKPAKEHFKQVVSDFAPQIWDWFKSEKYKIIILLKSINLITKFVFSCKKRQS